MASKLFLYPLIALLLATPPLAADPWGKDADLAMEKSAAAAIIPFGASEVGVALISFHKSVITHASGPRSHFRPSSSSYTLTAIQRYGFFQGGMMGLDRLMRENDDVWIYRVQCFDGTWWKYDPVP